MAFYYYLKVGPTFDHNIVLLTASLTLSFMIRNTSPVGWPPLIALKLFHDRSLVTFIKAGVLIAVPVILLCVLADSFYYGMEHFPVLTGYNFMNVNVVQGISKMFGTEPGLWYISFVFPEYFHVAYPLALYALGTGLWTGRNRHMSILVIAYVALFSALGHKERRFMQPVMPFCFLLAADAFSSILKQSLAKKTPYVSTVSKLFFLTYLIVNGIIGLTSNMQYSRRFWTVAY